MRRGARVIAAVGLSLSVRVGAAAAADCVGLPSPVYVTGSTAAKPLLAEVARLMAGQPTPVTIVYQGQGSCGGVDAILSGTTISGSGDSAFVYWDKNGLEMTCDVATPGVVANIGISDVFANSCFQLPGGLPASVLEVLGPVQAMVFVAHRLSVEKAISAEAAYYVYGFGSQSSITPWNFEGAIFKRDELSGTQRMIAAAIGVPAQRWKGTQSSSSNDLVARIGAATYPDQTIGILSAEVAQESRAAVKVLAYQPAGTTCAIFPDGTESGNDKANVRSGRYPIWGPLHLFTRLTSKGYPASAPAGEAIGYLTGTRPAPAGLDLVKVEAQRHVIPQCAMRVQRAQEMGPNMPYAPTGACGCSYEKLAVGTTSCKPCTTITDCPPSTPVCSYGYCEPQ